MASHNIHDCIDRCQATIAAGQVAEAAQFYDELDKHMKILAGNLAALQLQRPRNLSQPVADVIKPATPAVDVRTILAKFLHAELASNGSPHTREFSAYGGPAFIHEYDDHLRLYHISQASAFNTQNCNHMYEVYIDEVCIWLNKNSHSRDLIFRSSEMIAFLSKYNFFDRI